MSMIQFLNSLGDALEQGDVVVIGEKQPRAGRNQDVLPEVDLTDRIYDTRVCGVVSAVKVDLIIEAPGGEKLKTGRQKKQLRAGANDPEKPPQPEAHSIEELAEIDRTRIEPGHVGLLIASGMVPYCKVDADIAAIRAGDLLTTSPTKGHAQKVLDPGKATGAIVGKALGSLRKGQGRIPVLVCLQ